jgi:uncharacterized protein with ATP-grasp and redox domains
MKAELACIPCIVKQAYNTARRASDDPEVIKKILDLTADYVKTLDFSLTPADASNYVYQIAKEVTGVTDPYAGEKRKYNEICLGMTGKMYDIIEKAQDPLYTTAKIAIFGNLIDLGIGLQFDLDTDLDKILTVPFAADNYRELKELLSTGRKKILYLGDNTGEIVFDRLFIERLVQDHEVVFVVKRGPIINDATKEDTALVGMDKIVKVIDTGSDGIGVKWDSVSDEFREYYRNADIIISKGQGNFETMYGKKGDIFFLLRAKCESVARELGVKMGDIVLKRINTK